MSLLSFFLRITNHGHRWTVDIILKKNYLYACIQVTIHNSRVDVLVIDIASSKRKDISHEYKKKKIREGSSRSLKKILLCEAPHTYSKSQTTTREHFTALVIPKRILKTFFLWGKEEEKTAFLFCFWLHCLSFCTTMSYYAIIILS